MISWTDKYHSLAKHLSSLRLKTIRSSVSRQPSHPGSEPAAKSCTGEMNQGAQETNSPPSPLRLESNGLLHSTGKVNVVPGVCSMSTSS